MVVLTAAATAAIYVYGQTAVSVGFALGGAGGAIWTIGGFQKVLCPICFKDVRQRDLVKHTTEHPFECPSCHEQVALSDLEKHAREHGFRCSACLEQVPLAEFVPHIDKHRQEWLEDRRDGDELYQRRLEDLEREYEEKMAKLDREKAAFNEKRERARQLWDNLKSNCPICNVPVPMPGMKSHVMQHRLDPSPRQNQLGSMWIKLKGLKISALVNRRTRRR